MFQFVLGAVLGFLLALFIPEILFSKMRVQVVKVVKQTVKRLQDSRRDKSDEE